MWMPRGRAVLEFVTVPRTRENFASVITKHQRLRRRCERFARMGEPVSDVGRVAKNTVVLYVRMFVVMLVGFFTGRFQLQALGIDNFGLYQVAMATVGLFAFMNGSLSAAASRFLTVEMGKGTVGSLKRVFSTVFFAHLGMGVLVVLLLETVGMFVLDTKLNIPPDHLFAVRWAYQCGVVSTFLGVVMIPYNAAIIAHERMSAFAYMTLYDVGVKLLIVFLLFVSPVDRLVVYATLFLVVSLTTAAVYRFYCVRHFSEARFRRVFDVRLLRPVFSFVGWQTVSQMLALLVGEVLTLLNQRTFGPAVVASAAVASSVNGYVNGFVSNFKVAANPQVVKLFAARQLDESKRLMIETTTYGAFLLLVVGVPVALYAPELLSLWLGRSVPPLACEFVRLVLLTSFFANFGSSMFMVICADGRLKYNVLCDAILFPLTFASVWLALRLWGCPYTTAVGQACMTAAEVLLFKPIVLHFLAGYRLTDFGRMYALPFVALALCMAVDVGGWTVLPRTVKMALPDCAVLVFANAVMLYLIAPRELRRLVNECVRKVGGRLLRPLAARARKGV